MRAQAEPHIARSPNDPEFLVATFQEGRFTDGGAVDCGYSVTHDGGLTWTRALIPQSHPGHAADPIRAQPIPWPGSIWPAGFFSTPRRAIDADFTEGIILVSRSLDGGATFDPPAVVFEPANPNNFPDKPWMAVNTFVGTSTVGRILVTWTLFRDDRRVADPALLQRRSRRDLEPGARRFIPRA